jgi:hypothetical protein
MAQPQSRIARDGTLALNDLANPVRRNLNLPSQSARGKAEFSEFIAENFAGVDGVAGNDLILKDDLQFRLPMGHLHFAAT